MLLFSGQHRQRQVRSVHGTQDRCSHLRIARRRHRSETKDGDDSVRLPHGQGLHTQHGLQTRTMSALGTLNISVHLTAPA